MPENGYDLRASLRKTGVIYRVIEKNSTLCPLIECCASVRAWNNSDIYVRVCLRVFIGKAFRKANPRKRSVRVYRTVNALPSSVSQYKKLIVFFKRNVAWVSSARHI